MGFNRTFVRYFFSSLYMYSFVYSLSHSLTVCTSLSQIIFDGFSVGRFDEGLLDTDSDRNESHYANHIGDLPGCPEGFMQVIYATNTYYIT